MKATVIDKSDGQLTIRFDAINVIEAHIIACCSPSEDSGVNIQLSSSGLSSKVYVGSCAFEVHQMLQSK